MAMGQPAHGANPLASALLIGGAGFVSIGAFLPWATVSIFVATVSVNGTDGDGVLTLILGLAAGTLGIVMAAGPRQIWMPIVAIAVLALVLAIAAYDMSRVSTNFGEIGQGVHLDASVVIGLWMTAAGALAGGAGAILWVVGFRAGPMTTSPMLGHGVVWQAPPTAPPAGPPPGWFADANQPGYERWWDGHAWSEHVRAVSTWPEMQ